MDWSKILRTFPLRKYLTSHRGCSEERRLNCQTMNYPINRLMRAIDTSLLPLSFDMLLSLSSWIVVASEEMVGCCLLRGDDVWPSESVVTSSDAPTLTSVRKGTKMSSDSGWKKSISLKNVFKPIKLPHSHSRRLASWPLQSASWFCFPESVWATGSIFRLQRIFRRTITRPNAPRCRGKADRVGRRCLENYSSGGKRYLFQKFSLDLSLKEKMRFSFYSNFTLNHPPAQTIRIR